MKKPLQFALLLVTVALIAMGMCLFTQWIVPVVCPPHPVGNHMSIHKQLHITPEQDKSLHAIERRYAERRAQLTQTIRQANTELANVILEDKAASARVNTAIRKIHTAQGELQMVTIQHVFEMKTILTPKQADMLLKLTAEALQQDSYIYPGTGPS